MKYTIVLGLVCSSFLYASAQVSIGRPKTAVPSLSDILRDTVTFEAAVIDLSSAPSGARDSHGGFRTPQNGLGGHHSGHHGGTTLNDIVNHGGSASKSAKQGHNHGHGSEAHHESPAVAGGPTIITDSRGNVPPPPTGTHVDLPGEHGNNNDFAVIHHGESPIGGSPDVHSPVPQGSSKNSLHDKHLPHVGHLPGSEHTVPVPMESAHGPNTVSHGPGNIEHSKNPFHATNVHHDANKPGSRIKSNFVDLTAIDSAGLAFSDSARPSPILPVAGLLGLPPNGLAKLDTSVSKTNEFASTTDGFKTAPSEVHKGIPHVPNDQSLSGKVHVDLPGEHGNPIDGIPVVHRGNRGNDIPTGPVKAHIDMPGEHGNPINGFPTVHREVSAVPDKPSRNVHIEHTGIHIDQPGEHGNMLSEPALHLPPGATVQDAIDAGIIPDPSLPVEPQTGTLAEKPNAQKSGILVDTVHIDLPGEHGNPLDGHPVVHREGPSGVDHPNVSPLGVSNAEIQTGTPVSNVHVDLPGEHGNPINNQPVIHRPQSAIPVGNVHVDLPGEHGNRLNGHAVVHREGPHTLGVETGVHVSTGSNRPVGNVHVDLPGQHGNPTNGHPVIHREKTHGLSPPTTISGTSIFGPQTGVPLGNVHVDLPGEHGNPVDGHPVIHREGPHHGQQAGTPIGNVHVDLPGEHGNPVDSHPVIHRERPHLGPQAGTPIGNVHVDLPGEHGNPVDSHPVIHREGHHLGSQAGTPIGNVHVDLPGEHGNPIDRHPVIHREANNLGPHTGTSLGNVHVDLPGEHGNPINGHPVIHREVANLIPQTDILIGQTNHPKYSGIHIDAPGEHGNQLNEPALHLPPGATIEDAWAAGVIPDPVGLGPKSGTLTGNAHVDLPGEHGNPIDNHPVIHREASHLGPSAGTPIGNVHVDMPGEHGTPLNGIPTVHREAGVPGNLVGQKSHPGHSGIHIDASGHHGNVLNEPALHLPPGATIKDARTAGVIPGPGKFGPSAGGIIPGQLPVVKTGVLPGTMNVAIPNSGRHAFVNQGGIGAKLDNYPASRSIRGRNQGDLLGIPTVHLSESVGLNDLDRTNAGVVDDRSVLLSRGGRKRGGRGGGRRRGRGRGRRGRGRGRGGRKWRTTTTTTTTLAPKKSGGGGVTIIKTSRPNPLAALGNALRSALNVRNSGGGGLLGSLIRSAIGVQSGFGPPPRSAMVGPIRLQPVGGPVFGGLFRGKR